MTLLETIFITGLIISILVKLLPILLISVGSWYMINKSP
jgi:hypothetical protein